MNEWEKESSRKRRQSRWKKKEKERKKKKGGKENIRTFPTPTLYTEATLSAEKNNPLEM